MHLFISLFCFFLTVKHLLYRRATNSNTPAIRSQDTVCVFISLKGLLFLMFSFAEPDLEDEYKMHMHGEHDIANLAGQLENHYSKDAAKTIPLCFSVPTIVL